VTEGAVATLICGWICGSASGAPAAGVAACGGTVAAGGGAETGRGPDFVDAVVNALRGCSSHQK
jgi:hypothetical protein